MRGFFVWQHRWTGLLLTGFLVIVGLTGSLLAFRTKLEHLITPQLFATLRPHAAPLDLATLATRASAEFPHGRVDSVSLTAADQATVGFSPRTDPATGKPYELGFDQFFVDPWTGDELGRRRFGDISQGRVNLIPFIYNLHYELALGMPGAWVLGIVALLWTLDSFVGFYLTLPAGTPRFLRRWKLAWLVKWKAGAFRFNFDLHRAGGLWLWLMLLVFAWSSVYMNLSDTVYAWVTRALLDYRPAATQIATLPQPIESPLLDFRSALAAGELLMAQQAELHGFAVKAPIGLAYQPDSGVYVYTVRSTRDIRDQHGRTSVYFNANTGVFRMLDLPAGQYSGNTVTAWLSALHMADVFGMPYRILVCVLGQVIAILSITGVYIWWKKRAFRKQSASNRRLVEEASAKGVTSA